MILGVHRVWTRTADVGASAFRLGVLRPGGPGVASGATRQEERKSDGAGSGGLLSMGGLDSGCVGTRCTWHRTRWVGDRGGAMRRRGACGRWVSAGGSAPPVLRPYRGAPRAARGRIRLGTPLFGAPPRSRPAACAATSGPRRRAEGREVATASGPATRVAERLPRRALLAALRPQVEGAERRQGEHHRRRVAVRRLVLRHHRAVVADAGSAELRGVRVQQLLPRAGEGQADAVVADGAAGEVEQRGDGVAVLVPAQERERRCSPRRCRRSSSKPAEDESCCQNDGFSR